MSLNGKIIYYVLTGARKSSNAEKPIKDLVELGANVYVILTPNAIKFVNIIKLKEITGNPVRHSFKKRPGESLPLEEEVIIAPATFSSINKIANGVADNFALSCIAAAIGRGTPITIAPSMNLDLWNNVIIQKNISLLRSLGINIIHPSIEGNYCTMAFEEKIIDSLIHKYIGIRYNSHKVNDLTLEVELESYINYYFSDFVRVGEELLKYKFTSGTKGCMSLRLPKGFLITSSGSQIGNLTIDDLTWVIKVDEQNQKVFWIGKKPPSSETPLHSVILNQKKDINAVIHSHCPSITYSENNNKIKTGNYYSYGTFKFGYAVLNHIDKVNSNIVVARDHGEVSIGQNINEALNNLYCLLEDVDVGILS